MRLQARPFSRSLPLRHPSGHRYVLPQAAPHLMHFGTYSCVIFHFIPGLKVAELIEAQIIEVLLYFTWNLRSNVRYAWC
jgi:hypothetical protein